MSPVAAECGSTIVPGALREPFTERGSLRLFVRGDSRLSNCLDSLSILATRVSHRSQLVSGFVLRGTNVSRTQFAGRPLGLSFLLHCLFLALVFYLPQAIPVTASSVQAAPWHAEKIYYHVSPLDPRTVLKIAPAGPGGRPGSGFVPARLPALGSSAPHPNMTIVSKPSYPDNFHQTIYQPASPPDLKITTDQKLPNVVMGTRLDALKAPLDPNSSKPTQADRKVSAIAAPNVTAATNSPLMTFLKPSESQPRLAIPLAGGGGPIQRGTSSTAGAVAAGNSTDPSGLIALGVDPADPSSQFSLPGGNRWGEFTVAPPSGTSGSPGGDPGGTVGGGSGGSTLGGDGSVGVGSGSSGGGGGNGAAPGPVSVEGRAANGEPGGMMLEASIPASMIYPVAAPAINVRKNALVITAGPMGGGGLNVYNALPCGKIYSIFLPMPGRNWSMQYCDKTAVVQKVPSGGQAAVIHMDNSLMPPDYDPDQRFDFKRLPVPIEKSHRMIVLKGVIATDGTVQHLTVYQGVLPQMDEAAVLAFGKWHFKPTKKDGKPVEVDILVGIPSASGEDWVNH